MDELSKKYRQQIIINVLNRTGRVITADLSTLLGASRITIRRDLEELHTRGKLHRTFRGALPLQNTKSGFQARMQQESHAKQAIGLKARELVQEGDSIFIGPGSTTAYFANFLIDIKDLTVITNAIHIAISLAKINSEIHIVVIGGSLYAQELFCFGHIAEDNIKELHINKNFFGAQALNITDGWTTGFLPEVNTIRSIIKKTSDLILLADHTKLGKGLSGRIAPLSCIGKIITDSGSDGQVLEGSMLKNLSV